MGRRHWVGDDTYCYAEAEDGSNSSTLKFAEQCRRHCSFDVDYVKMDISIQSVLFALSIAGNCILLSVFISKRREMTRSRVFIFNLCCADLCVALFVTLSSGIEKMVLYFTAPVFFCKILKLMLIAPLYASAFSILAMGIDRYLAVYHPFLNFRWQLRQWLIIIGVVWLLSFVFATPQLIFFDVVEIEKCHVRRCIEVYDRFPNTVLQVYVTWFCFVSYFIPAVALLVIYSMICRKVWNRYRIEDQKQVDLLPSSEGAAFLSIPQSAGKRASETPSIDNTRASLSGKANLIAIAKESRSRRSMRQVSIAHTGEYKAQATRAKMRMLIMTAVIVALFVLWNAPYACSMIWLTLVDENSPIARSQLFMICTTLANANASFNSWIYICFNRSALCHCGRSQTNTETSFRGTSIRWTNDNSKVAGKPTVTNNGAAGRRSTRPNLPIGDKRGSETTSVNSPTQNDWCTEATNDVEVNNDVKNEVQNKSNGQSQPEEAMPKPNSVITTIAESQSNLETATRF